MTNHEDRQEHLAWAKTRALEYIELGDIDEAVRSFISDMKKHRELSEHPGINLLLMAQMKGMLNPNLAKKFINDCN